MPISTQDFTKGVDFTGFLTVDGSHHNALIELAEPKSDGGADNRDGKGLIIRTIDDPAGTPTVPDPGLLEKWKRYVWLRVKGDGTNTPVLYGWDETLVADPVLLKWSELSADVSSMLADIAKALQDSADALAKATNAETLATTANTNAGIAISTANTATQNVNNLTITVNSFDQRILTAQSTADAALILAQSLQSQIIKKYESGLLPIPKAELSTYGKLLYTLPHNLGGYPTHVRVFVRCITDVYAGAQFLFPSGYEIPIENFFEGARGGDKLPYHVFCDGTNFYVKEMTTLVVDNVPPGTYTNYMMIFDPATQQNVVPITSQFNLRICAFR